MCTAMLLHACVCTSNATHCAWHACNLGSNGQLVCRDALQRTILPLIANELLQRLQLDTLPEGSQHRRSPDEPVAAALQKQGSQREALERTSSYKSNDSSSANGSASDKMRCSNGSLADLSRHRHGSMTGMLDRLRSRAESSPGLAAIASGCAPAGSLIRNPSSLFLAATAMHEGSVHGRSRMRRGISRDTIHADEQIKAARYDLDLHLLIMLRSVLTCVDTPRSIGDTSAVRAACNPIAIELTHAKHMCSAQHVSYSTQLR
jgi:hypothetical protein